MGRRGVHALRVALYVLGSIVAGALGLVALALLALKIPPVRDFAVRQGVAYANRSLDGMRVAVAHVDRVDVWGVNVRGIQLFDAEGRELVQVKWLLVRIRPFALVRRTLALTRVEVDGVRARLYDEESEPEKPQEPEAPSEPWTFTIRADHVRVRDAELTTSFQDRTLHARLGTLAGGGQYGPRPALALAEANLRVTAGDDVLLQLRTKEGAWRAERGGRMALEAELAGAPLTLEAELPPLAEVEPWPVHSLRLRLSGLDRHALAALGVEDGAQLHVPIELALDVRTNGDRLDAEAKVRAGPGALSLVASADPRAYELKVVVPPTALASIAGILPDLRVRGRLRARASPTHLTNATPERVELAWSDVAIDDGAVPAGIVRAELRLPIVRLTGVHLVGLERAFAVHGEYDTERRRGSGAIKFDQLSLEQVEALQKQGVAGTLNGGLSAKYGERIEAQGKLEFRGLAAPGARLSAFDLELALSGTPQAPLGHFKLHAAGLTKGEWKLDELRSEAEATPEHLTGRLELRGPDTALKVELGGQRTTQGDLRAQAIGRGKVANRELRFDLRELLYGEHGLSVQELSLYSGDQLVRASGALDGEQRVRAALALSRIDLAEWATVAKIGGVMGRLDATAKIEGTTRAPRLEADVELTRAAYRSELPFDASLQIKGDLGARRAEAHLNMASDRAPKKGSQAGPAPDREYGARVHALVTLPQRPRDLGRAALRARIQADASLNLPVEQISALGGDQLAGLGGMLEAKLTAEGTLDEPKVEAEINARLKLPERSGDPVEGLHVTASVNKEQGKLNVWAKDELGELLTADAFVAWPGGSPRAALEREIVWRDARFEAHAELKPRRFDTMQGVFAYFSKLYALSLPIRAAAKVSLDGEGGHLDGSARAQLVVFGDKLDGRCQLGAQSSADLDFKLTQDRIEGQLNARTDGGGSIRGKLDSRLDLGAQGGTPFGPAKLDLTGQQIALHKLPGLCNLASGRATFHASAQGLGPQRPALALDAQIDDLRAPDQPPLSVQAKANVKDNAALSAELKSGKRAVGSLQAKVPLSYPDGTTPTVLPDAPIEARIKLDRLALANVLAFTEQLGRVGGNASADLTVKGPLRAPYPEGYLQFEDVNLSIASLAQPLRDIQGRVEVKGYSAKIPKITARDRDGKLMLEGYATLHEDGSGDGGLYVEADRFPLRQQGTIIGELTTRARLDAKMPPDQKVQAQLKILDGQIWVTGERGKKVQPLDPHPDVRFADEKVEHEATPAEEEAEEQSGAEQGIALGLFKMRTEQELWLNHKDFALQVGVDITLSEGEDGPRLEGQATLHRGKLTLLGKQFELERGAIRFTGPMPPDPELDIKAVYKPPAGESLVVQVSGHGSAPVLEFSGAATTAGEAVAVLTGMGAGSANQSGAANQASADMANIAMNMTAGLLVMSARRKFGDWVPMLSVETGQGGELTGASAGFDASKLIPPWAKGFARAAYVEGVVGQTGTSSAAGYGWGVKLEVAMPRDFVTSLGYGPTPGSWSTDVTWSP